MTQCLKVRNNRRFWWLWKNAVRTSQIAEEFGVKRPAITRAANRYNYPPRSREGRELSAPMPPCPCGSEKEAAVQLYHQAEALQQAEANLPEVRAVNCWSIERDVEILRSGGRYTALVKLADRWGETYQAITARWHKLRVM